MMATHHCLPRLLAMLIPGVVLLAACAPSGSRPAIVAHIPLHELPLCSSVHLVEEPFKLDEQWFAYLDVGPSGVISNRGVEVWRSDEPFDTAELDRILSSVANGMAKDGVIPDGWLVISADPGVDYGTIAFLIRRCLRPRTPIWKYQFLVQTINGEHGFLGFHSAPDPLSEWNKERRNVTLDVHLVNGASAYSVNGDAPTSLSAAIQALKDTPSPYRLRPTADVAWGVVVRVVGELLHTGLTTDYQLTSRWDDGFFLRE